MHSNILEKKVNSRDELNTSKTSHEIRVVYDSEAAQRGSLSTSPGGGLDCDVQKRACPKSPHHCKHEETVRSYGEFCIVMA